MCNKRENKKLLFDQEIEKITRANRKATRLVKLAEESSQSILNDSQSDKSKKKGVAMVEA
jgi:hypothetical protein